MNFLTNTPKNHPNLKAVIDSNLVRLQNPATNPFEEDRLVSSNYIGLYCKDKDRLDVLILLNPESWSKYKPKQIG